tara:strand:+ start:333 stop:446 length:114 start_codon:yes stop_codon:yes gene_type:complete
MINQNPTLKIINEVILKRQTALDAEEHRLQDGMIGGN